MVTDYIGSYDLNLINDLAGEAATSLYTDLCMKQVIQFKEGILRSLLPSGMSDEDGSDYLIKNGVKFVEYSDGKQELYGFGIKLGDIFYGLEEKEQGTSYFTTKFTPDSSLLGQG